MVSPFSREGARQIAPSRTIAYGTLRLDQTVSDYKKADAKGLLALGKKSEQPELRVELAGFVLGGAEQSSFSSEGLGLLVAALILLISFGSLLAMGLPILIAVIGLGIGLSLVTLLANVLEVPDFAPQVAAMIGIGVGIDYVLFIVTRYRNALHGGLEPRAAVITAITTSGRAVIFAGCTVIISLLGLFVMNLGFLRGSGGRCGVRRAGGDARVGHPAARHARLHRAHDRPVPSAVRQPQGIGRSALALVSVEPGHTTQSVASRGGLRRRAHRPRRSGSAHAFRLSRLRQLAEEVHDPAGVRPAEPRASDRGSMVRCCWSRRLRERTRLPRSLRSPPPWLLTPTCASSARRARAPTGRSRCWSRIRSRHRRRRPPRISSNGCGTTSCPRASSGTGVTVFVGGSTAASVDATSYVADRLGVFIGVVIVLSFLLLLVVFRSVLVPLKAAIMNLLSVGGRLWRRGDGGAGWLARRSHRHP